MEDLKYQAFDVTVGAGINSAIDTVVELDRSYPLCTGIAVYEKADGGISSYDISFADDQKTYHDFVDKKDFMPGDGVPLNERYKNVIIENIKQRFKIRVRPDVPTVSPIRFQMVFRMAKELPQ